MATFLARSLSRSLPSAARRAVVLPHAQLPRAPLALRTAALALCSSAASHRAFSTASEDSAAADAVASSTAIDSMDENRFLELAEETLNEIQTWIDGIEEMLEESDVTLSQGVLKIDLGEHGTWVLNRQVPNRQIWWSSPISGPRRYELDAATGKWLNTRDKTELFERLQDEISDATGISIFN